MEYAPLYIIDFIESVVDGIRSTGTISSISAKQSDGSYIITVPDTTDIVVNDYVLIGDATDLQVISKTTSTFTVMPLFSASVSGSTWKTAKPYYYAGHSKEIANMLNEKTLSGEFKYQKYPLVGLYFDIPEEYGAGEIKSVAVDLFVLFVTDSKQEYTTEDRYTNTLKPILYPLYQSFFDSLEANRKYLDMKSDESFKYTKIDRPYNGSEGKDQNTLNAITDAIEIKGLKLKVLLQPKYNC